VKSLKKLLIGEATLLSVVGFWLSLATISFLFLTDESGDDSLFGEKFGVVSYTKANVRSKKASKFSWFTVERESLLAKNDSIKTGPDSAAIVDMTTGGSLEIGENSLVILKDTSSISNNFIQGTLIIRDQNGDRKINVDENGIKTEEKLSYRWTEPRLAQEYYVPSSQSLNVNFKWEKLKNASESSEVFFDISQYPLSLKKEISSTKLNPDALTHSVVLKNSKYYYQLRSSDGSPLTEARAFSIKALKPLFLSPVVAYTLESKATLRLNWNLPKDSPDVYAAGEHSLELARDADFLQILSTTELNPLSGFVDSSVLEAGVYFGRIKSQVKGFNFSGPDAKITLNQINEVALELLSPQAMSSLASGQAVHVQWSTQPQVLGALNYELQIKDEKATQLKENVRTNSFVWTTVPDGKYFAQVTTYIGEQKKVESPWVSFFVGEVKSLALKTPRMAETFKAWPDKKKIQFAWDVSKDKRFDSFVLELSTTEDFSQIYLTQATQDKSVSVEHAKIKEGPTYWRVNALLNSKVAESSRVSRFEFAYPELLPAASVGRLKSRFNLRREKLPSVNWDSVEGAVGYEVELQRQDASGRGLASINTQKTSRTKYQIPNLKEGQYELVLWPIDLAQRRGEPVKKTFVVEYGAPLKAPRLRKVEVE